MTPASARYESQYSTRLSPSKGAAARGTVRESSGTPARGDGQIKRALLISRHPFLKVQQEFGSFDAYIWRFVNGKPKQNKWKRKLPARTKESDAMSKDLVKRGFRFVGSTICYALMQATGMVNDHSIHCFRYRQLGL